MKRDLKELTEAVLAVQESARKLLAGGLTRKCILVLLSNHTGVGQKIIDTVLDGMETLADKYLTEEDDD